MYYKDITLTGPQAAIGYEDENLPTRVIIDISDLTKYGTGTTVLEVKRPCDREAYIAEQTEVDGNNFYWYPTKGDLEVSGLLKCQVKAVIGDQIVKTRVYFVQVIGALDGDGTLSGVVPDALQTFVESVSGSEDAAKASAEEAKKAEEAAKASETAATKSASDADASASAAADSAKQSYDQATASANSATASATSAGESEQSKTQAQEYAQNAYNSAVGAESAKDDAEDARDEIRSMRAEAVTLSPGSDATARYSDGLLSLGIPRGEKGDKGDTGEQGPKGDKGDPGEVTQAEFDEALAKKSPTIYEEIESVPFATFADGAEDMSLKDLKVAIEPVQAGSGDPSPDNVRPISGWTGAKVTRTGKNLCYETRLNGPANILFFIDKPVSNTITLSATINVATSSNSIYLNVDGTTKGLVGLITGSAGEKQTKTLTLSDAQMEFIKNGSKVCLLLYKDGADFTLPTDAQVELGSTATSYEPYQGETYPITFPSEAGTVYGGTLDVTNGELVVDRAQVASYNGETLPGKWISDRDVYAAGASPTTGAQVVYELATPITYQLTPLEVSTLLGQNNIWANTGDMSVTYRADTKLYIDNKIAELQALVLEN